MSRSQGSAGMEPYHKGVQTSRVHVSKKHLWIERWVCREKIETEGFTGRCQLSLDGNVHYSKRQTKRSIFYENTS